MSFPTFEGFSLNDDNFIAERVFFKGYASRALIQGKINRREGVKLLNTEFGPKEVTVEGVVIGSSASDLQTLLDNLKKNLVTDEGALMLETGRTFVATAKNITIPDEHYNQTKAPFEVTFLLSNPFAEGDQLSVVQDVPSGTTTFSGLFSVSGTYFSRPTIVYTPPTAVGDTLIKRLDVTHTPTGQTITISGFGSGGAGGLTYQNAVTINFDDFTSLEGAASINNSGAFPRWEPGNNEYTVTVSGRAYPGGTFTATYKPRYL